ncbi:MAG: hypothetical protein ACREE2_00940 [Stellaceae bacterium]
MSEADSKAYAANVRRAIKEINPAVSGAADNHGWPAALDAVSTILMSLLIAAVGGDEARAACSRMYEEVARLEHAWAPLLASDSDLDRDPAGEPQGRA